MSGFSFIVFVLFIVCIVQQERRKKQSARKTTAPRKKAVPTPDVPNTPVEAFHDEASEEEPLATTMAVETEPETLQEDYFGEGELPEEHAEHMRRADEERAREALKSEKKRRFNSSDLRRAVVAREILDRPLSMR